MRPLACPRCNGKGKSVTFREREHIYMSWYTWQDCPVCQGTGYHQNRLDTVKNPFAVSAPPLVTFASCFSAPRANALAPTRTPRATTVKL